jgi:hypothetical protein
MIPAFLHWLHARAVMRHDERDLKAIGIFRGMQGHDRFTEKAVPVGKQAYGY